MNTNQPATLVNGTQRGKARQILSPTRSYRNAWCGTAASFGMFTALHVAPIAVDPSSAAGIRTVGMFVLVMVPVSAIGSLFFLRYADHFIVPRIFNGICVLLNLVLVLWIVFLVLVFEFSFAGPG